MNRAYTLAQNTATQVINGVEPIDDDSRLVDKDVISIDQKTVETFARYKLEKRHFNAISIVMDKNSAFNTSPRERLREECYDPWSDVEIDPLKDLFGICGDYSPDLDGWSNKEEPSEDLANTYELNQLY